TCHGGELGDLVVARPLRADPSKHALGLVELATTYLDQCAGCDDERRHGVGYVLGAGWLAGLGSGVPRTAGVVGHDLHPAQRPAVAAPGEPEIASAAHALVGAGRRDVEPA